MTHM